MGHFTKIILQALLHKLSHSLNILLNLFIYCYYCICSIIYHNTKYIFVCISATGDSKSSQHFVNLVHIKKKLHLHMLCSVKLCCAVPISRGGPLRLWSHVSMVLEVRSPAIVLLSSH